MFDIKPIEPLVQNEDEEDEKLRATTGLSRNIFNRHLSFTHKIYFKVCIYLYLHVH